MPNETNDSTTNVPEVKVEKRGPGRPRTPEADRKVLFSRRIHPSKLEALKAAFDEISKS